MSENVIAAIAAVMAELPAIGKDQQASAQQGGYAYRGIEQITRHTQGLFAKHGIVFVPRVVHHEIRDIVVNGKPWTDTVELVEYDVFGPGGTEDKITVGPILAVGRDNSDKGANKCMTQAFKYALLQCLCISDAKDDGDGSTHEADAAPVDPAPGLRSSILGSIEKMGEDARAELKGWMAARDLPAVRRMTADQCDQVIEWIVNQPKDPT